MSELSGNTNDQPALRELLSGIRKLTEGRVFGWCLPEEGIPTLNLAIYSHALGENDSVGVAVDVICAEKGKSTAFILVTGEEADALNALLAEASESTHFHAEEPPCQAENRKMPTPSHRKVGA